MQTSVIESVLIDLTLDEEILIARVAHVNKGLAVAAVHTLAQNHHPDTSIRMLASAKTAVEYAMSRYPDDFWRT